MVWYGNEVVLAYSNQVMNGKNKGLLSRVYEIEQKMETLDTSGSTWTK